MGKVVGEGDRAVGKLAASVVQAVVELGLCLGSSGSLRLLFGGLLLLPLGEGFVALSALVQDAGSEFVPFVLDDLVLKVADDGFCESYRVVE